MLTRWQGAGFSLSAECRGAGGTTGGDFYTIAVRGPGHIGVVIGDMCGRGAEGHAHLSRLLPKLHALALSGRSPSSLLTELNQAAALELPIDRFVTAAAFELDIRAAVLTVANAAHVPAIVRRARGRDVLVAGRASGIPLGIDRNTTYAEERFALNRGDVVVLMTDGLLEAVEPDLLTMGTLKGLLAGAYGGHREVHRLLLRKLDEGADSRVDDMTLLAMEAAPHPSWRSLERMERCAYLS